MNKHFKREAILMLVIPMVLLALAVIALLVFSYLGY
jgi:hypothetical protein